MSQSTKSELDILIEKREQCRTTDANAHPEALKEMLLYLHAPKSLFGCVQAVHNLTKIFRQAIREKICKEPDCRNFFLYIRELRWITHNQSGLAQDLFGDDSNRERFLRRAGTNPLIGQGARDHGLWCLLWEIHPSKENELKRAFLTLQLHATLAHVAILKYRMAQEEWLQNTDQADAILNTLYRETLSIRHFVMKKYKDADERIALLKRIPRGVSNADLYGYIRDASVKHKASEDSEPTIIYLDLVRVLWLLHHASHPDKFRFRDRSRLLIPHEVPDDLDTGEDGKYADPYEIGGFELENFLDDDDDDRTTDTSSSGEEEEDREDCPKESDILVTTRHKWSQAQIKECVESGLHPSEVLSTHAMYLSRSKSGRIGARDWVEMDNQLLPWSRENLPIEIVARGMNILKSASGSGALMDIELFVRALVILRTGATKNVVQSMQVRSDYPSTVDVLTLVLPASEGAGGVSGQWLVPVVPLAHRDNEVAQYDGCRECVPSFPLPDYSGIGSLMRQLLDQKSGGVWNGEPVCPFVRGAREYQNALKDRLRGDTQNTKGILHLLFTFPRLGMLHFQRIHDLAAGNTVPATYITLRPRRPGEIPRFYETPAIESLQFLDKRSIASIAEELNNAGFHWGIDLGVNCTRSEGFVGSPICPRVLSLRDYLSQLRRDFINTYNELSKKTSPNGLQWAKMHNLYTAYTYAGYNIATCHRAVVGGYTDIGRLEAGTGMITLEDKGDRKRLVPIVGPVLSQMCEYERVLSFPIYEQLFGDAPRHTMFFLDVDWKIQQIAPSTLKPYLPFPPNFGRHFVRTMLAERIYKGEAKIPNEYLNELLGHAVEGEERSGQYSSFAYRKYASAVRESMSALFNEIDYWPISFHGQRIPVLDPYV